MKKPYVLLEFVSINKGKRTVFIDGQVGGLNDALDINLLECLYNKQLYRVKKTDRNSTKLKNSQTFTLELSITQKPQSITFFYCGSQIVLKTGMFTRIPDMFLGYRMDEDEYILRGIKKIYIGKVTSHKKILFEIMFMIRTIFYWRFDRVINAYINRKSSIKGMFTFMFKSFFIVSETIMYLPINLYIRLHVRKLNKQTSNKPLWLISDRIMAAGDNGEALFCYIKSLDDCPADVRFVISKKSKDYSRIKSIGPVIDADSVEYKILFLHASKIISSQADIETINPFLRQYNHVVDLFRYDFIFLQHGVTRHDMSGWLNKYNRNIHLLITSSKLEYDSIINLPYGYSKSNLLLSGMPRFDQLKSNPKGKIILAPTYRNQLIINNTNKTGQRPYSKNFKYSEYFEFYSSFMHNKRVIKLLQDYNLTLDFYLHPVFSAQYEDFQSSSERVNIKTFPYDYQKAFSEGDILITDYSSVVFDFVYLKKPVIYSQFDKENFYSGQVYSDADFFSDNEHGFGPVVETLDETILELEKILLSGSRMPQKYSNRVDNFFEYMDTNNSKRVYESLIVK